MENSLRAARARSIGADTETDRRGVYGVMRCKPAIICLCVIIALATVLLLGKRGRTQHSAQAATNQVLVSPDGTMALPPNDHWKIIANLPKVTTNAGTTGAPPSKK